MSLRRFACHPERSMSLRRCACHPERERGIWSGGWREAASSKRECSEVAFVVTWTRPNIGMSNPRARHFLNKSSNAFRASSGAGWLLLTLSAARSRTIRGENRAHELRRSFFATRAGMFSRHSQSVDVSKCVQLRHTCRSVPHWQTDSSTTSVSPLCASPQ